jgi:hypothetical protein
VVDAGLFETAKQKVADRRVLACAVGHRAYLLQRVGAPAIHVAIRPDVRETNLLDERIATRIAVGD